MDKRDIFDWYAPLAATGVLTPETYLIPAPPGVFSLAGDALPPGYAHFLAALAAAGDRLGWPVFLRASHGAAKLRWRDSCWVECPAQLHDHVIALVRWSAEKGLPCRGLAVRQALPLGAYLFTGAGTPIAREWRVSVDGDAILCRHHLWPRRAVEMARPTPADWVPLFEDISRLGESEERVLLNLSAHVGRTLRAAGVPGRLSLDWCLIEDGRWVALELDDYQSAWHHPDCPHHPAARRSPEEPCPEPIHPATYALSPDDPRAVAELWQLERCLEVPEVPGE